MSSRPDVRFVIVPHRPRARLLLLAVVLAWLGSLWLAFDLSRRISVPQFEQTRREHGRLSAKLAETTAALADERQRNAVLARSDQISRAANDGLQQTVLERDEEIAALRSDVAFYERLVGGSAQRKGLAVHALSLGGPGSGDLQYTLTLTQTLKRSGLTDGEVVLELEGVRDGKLTTLDWNALRQGADSTPQRFSFRYFQQLEGSIMVPEDFTPHRVRVEVRAGDNRIERIFPWQEVLPPQGA